MLREARAWLRADSAGETTYYAPVKRQNCFYLRSLPREVIPGHEHLQSLPAHNGFFDAQAPANIHAAFGDAVRGSRCSGVRWHGERHPPEQRLVQVVLRTFRAAGLDYWDIFDPHGLSACRFENMLSKTLLAPGISAKTLTWRIEGPNDLARAVTRVRRFMKEKWASIGRPYGLVYALASHAAGETVGIESEEGKPWELRFPHPVIRPGRQLTAGPYILVATVTEDPMRRRHFCLQIGTLKPIATHDWWLPVDSNIERRVALRLRDLCRELYARDRISVSIEKPLFQHTGLPLSDFILRSADAVRPLAIEVFGTEQCAYHKRKNTQRIALNKANFATLAVNAYLTGIALIEDQKRCQRFIEDWVKNRARSLDSGYSVWLA